MKKLYRQYESMKAHHEEMKDIAEFKTSLGYPTTRRKGQIEPRTKARENKATLQARVERLEEVTDILKTEKLMTSIGLSQVRTRLQDLKEMEPKTKQEESVPPPEERPKKKAKTRAQREPQELVQEEEEEEEEGPTRMDVDPTPKPKLVIKDPSPVKESTPIKEKEQPQTVQATPSTLGEFDYSSFIHKVSIDSPTLKMPSPIASLSKTGFSKTLPAVEEKEKEVQSDPQGDTEKKEQATQVQEQIEEEMPKEPEDTSIP